MEILKDLIVIFSITLIVGFTLKRVGIPIIAGFIFAGILIGPHVSGLVPNFHEVEALAEVGVALLLFSIGVELSLEKLKRLWKSILFGGGFQVMVTVLLTFGVCRWFEIPWRQSIFFGFLMALSSTAIVLRGLQTRGELHSPHGQFALGILVFQDLCVIPMMLALPLLVNAGASNFLSSAREFFQSIALCLAILFGGRILVPRILQIVARNRERELFVLTVVLACLSMALLSHFAGASFALGAFLAGIVVSGTHFRDQALLDLLPFREVFVSLFFVSIGMLFDPKILFEYPVIVLALFLSILIGKTIVVFFVARVLQLPVRIALLSALALAQIGEFSFILASVGLKLLLIDGEKFGIFLAAVIPSMLITPIFIRVSPHVVASVSQLKWLSHLFHVRGVNEIPASTKSMVNHFVVAGYGLAGQKVVKVLRGKEAYVVVDFNLDNVELGESQNEPIFFGDVTRREVLERLSLKQAKMLVIAINDPDANARAVKIAREIAPNLNIVVRGQYELDRTILEKAGANSVVIAEKEAAEKVASLVMEGI